MQVLFCFRRQRCVTAMVLPTAPPTVPTRTG
nr:MAG TPA: hypothetical protein [Caudoviricetes sp.]